MKKDFEKTEDSELIRIIRGGDKDALDFLLNKYKNLARRVAKRFFLVGGDNDDVMQEGMIGLYSAISDFDETAGASFSTFAETCIKRRITKAIEKSNAGKNQPLNSFLQLPDGSDSEDGDTMDKVSAGTGPDPESLVLEHEADEKLFEKIRESLSPFEYKVLLLYIDDLSYAEIAEKLSQPEKSVDNAIQRIRKKIRKII